MTKQRPLAANIKVFQAKNNQLQRPPVLGYLIHEFMTLAILSHNKPIQNIWISALETFLLRKQVTVTDPTNVQKRRERENIAAAKDIQVRSGLGSAEQFKAGIFSAGCHQVCLHRTESSSLTFCCCWLKAGMLQGCTPLLDTAVGGAGMLSSSANENEEGIGAT